MVLVVDLDVPEVLLASLHTQSKRHLDCDSATGMHHASPSYLVWDKDLRQHIVTMSITGSSLAQIWKRVVESEAAVS